jgi:hypothetical protein
MADYFAGRPLGFQVQLSGLGRLLLNPAILVASRPFMAAGRQAILASLLVGQADPMAYILPGVALVILSASLLGLLPLARLRAERLALTVAIGVMGLSCLWFVLLLTIGRLSSS